MFLSQKKIPNYDKKQDSPAARIWVGAQVKEEAPSSSVQQKVEKVTINPNVDPIPDHSDLLPGSSTWTTGTPDKKDQVNGVVPPQTETQTTQGKDQKELEKQQKLAAEKAKKDVEKQEKKTDKPSERKETATLTRDSKFEDLATLSGQYPNLKFEFNKGVLQTDGNGEYILMDGEKYYDEKHYENNDQKRDLKYYYVNRNATGSVKIQFWKVEGGYVQPDFTISPTPEK